VAVPVVGAPTGTVDAGIASGSSGNGAAIGDRAGVALADGAALEADAGDAAFADKSVRATQTDADRSVRATPAGATPASATQAGAQTAMSTTSAAAAIHGAGGAALSTAIGAAVSEVIPEMMAQAHTRAPKAGSPGASGAERRMAADGSEIVDIPVALIDKNPYQTRYFTHEDDEELLALSESIKAQGLIQPVTVRPGKDGRYFLITGWRRTQATKMAGLATIAAIVRRVSDQQAAEMTVIENLLREDLNCMDEVRAFVMLSQTFRMTQDQIAKRIGCSRERVSNYMRLARLPEEVQGFLRDNQLEFSHARMLLRLEDDQVILRVARKAAAEHMSVEALEDLVREKAWPVEEEKKPGAARWVDPNVRAMQQSLERTLGLRVRIRDRRGKGNILIEYGSLEDFDRVVGMLGGKSGR
jgi:ParB family chromosome partitioning protein